MAAKYRKLRPVTYPKNEANLIDYRYDYSYFIVIIVFLTENMATILSSHAHITHEK